MELELGLGQPIHPMKGLDLSDDNSYEVAVKSKRSFEEAFDHEKKKDETQMLGLQLWSAGDDDKGGQKKRAYSPIAKDDEQVNDHIAGWPPVKTWRKNKSPSDHHHQHQWKHNYFVEEDNTGGSSNSMYVKVKMEGVAIVRKIDLMLYNSYQTLTTSLINMFSTCYTYEKEEDNHVRYTLTYQDKQGDWLLAGDVPWQSFIKSVRRLEIIRSCTHGG